MGILDQMKADIQNVGGNKGKFFYVRDGERRRVRFLQEATDAFDVKFHDKFGNGNGEDSIQVPCQEIYGRECRYCDDSTLRTRTQYAWTVWDYESNEVKALMYPANKNSPVPALISMYETYGTLLDRDYMISVSGKGTNKTFSVVPMDKSTYKNNKAKPFTKSAFLKILDAAYPDTLYGGGSRSGHGKDAIDDFNEAMNEPEDDAEGAYDGKTPKELFKLCKERDIEVEPKKPAAYYKRLLEEHDKAQEDWGDEEEDEDEWQDE